jgi:hypothetical protein
MSLESRVLVRDGDFQTIRDELINFADRMEPTRTGKIPSAQRSNSAGERYMRRETISIDDGRSTIVDDSKEEGKSQTGVEGAGNEKGRGGGLRDNQRN